MLYGLNEAEAVFKALSAGVRLRVLALLSKREMCVCELAHVLGVTQPAVSRHLKILKRSGLIQSEKAGFWTNYRLRRSDPLVKNLLRRLAPGFRNDPRAKADLRKLKTADRKTLCRT